MATSGTTTWTLTESDIISEALENIGVLDIGDSPETNDTTSARRALNLLLKGLQADPSIQLRFIEDKTVSLSASTTSYNLEADTKKVMDFWLRISNVDTHLEVISKEEYDLISGKTAAGQPLKVYIDYAPDTPKAYFYPVPDATYTAYYVHEREIEDMTTGTDNVDLPVEALDMVVNGLCAKLAPKFGLGLDERAYWSNQFELSKRDYRAGDTNRYGREVVAPAHVV